MTSHDLGGCFTLSLSTDPECAAGDSVKPPPHGEGTWASPPSLSLFSPMGICVSGVSSPTPFGSSPSLDQW